MNNILSHCELVDARKSASEKDLPVPVWCLQDKILPRSGYRLTTNPDEEPNYVSLLMADGLRRRNVGSSAAQIGPVHDKTTIPTQNVVNYAPTRENQLKLHTLNNVGQAMVIRLALDSTSQTGTKAHT